MMYCGWTDVDGNSLVEYSTGIFYSSLDGKEFSNKPYTKEDKVYYKQSNRNSLIREKIISHLNRTNRGLIKELELIKIKKSTLPAYCRKWLLKVNNN